jgi:hypothetical protein
MSSVFSFSGLEFCLMFCSVFRKENRISALTTFALGAALLTSPYLVIAQRGGGGGHIGGGTAGGSGLSGGGKASGVAVSDDLKDFHAVMAVQATSQQIAAYAAMMKSTEAAYTELQAFIEKLGNANGGAASLGQKNNAQENAGQENKTSGLIGRGTTLEQAIEKARTENKAFLNGFSERQKSGLKEISKRLIKADSDLQQQAKVLDQQVQVVDAKAAGLPIVGSAQNLERALTTFRSQQVGLGQEMSISDGDNGENIAFTLLPVKNSVRFANQPVAISTSGMISKDVTEGGQNTFRFELTADMSALQQNFTEVLRAQVDRADRCGDRIAIQSAILTAPAPASLVVTQLHFERWTCGAVFGRETASEIVEGNGTIDVRLTPTVKDGTLRLVVETGHVNAAGLVGDLLRSGSLGDTLRDAISESLLSAMRQGGDFKAVLPPTAQGNATLRRAQFQSPGPGRFLVTLDGDIQISNEKVAALTTELKGRSIVQPAQVSSQESTQQTVPR